MLLNRFNLTSMNTILFDLWEEDASIRKNKANKQTKHMSNWQHNKKKHTNKKGYHAKLGAGCASLGVYMSSPACFTWSNCFFFVVYVVFFLFQVTHGTHIHKKKGKEKSQSINRKIAKLCLFGKLTTDAL